MTFWKSQSGTKIDGSAENAHVGTFKVIPDNTTAAVTIKDIALKNYEGDEFYQAIYKIVDGDFKGSEVRHNIKCFVADKKKRDREVNMLMRLYKICEKEIPNHQPEGNDLLQLKGCLLGVKIQEWFMDGKEGNWISEIHALGDNFVSESGKKVEHVAYIESALTRNAPRDNIEIDTDVPF